LPDSLGTIDENTLICDSIPDPEPAMMLSANAFPSMSAPATSPPPLKSASNGAKR
jgi:hypothetical protein